MIVTYNRKELLGRNIEMLLRQTKPFNKIFVIDNCSTDGTFAFLEEKGWLESGPVIYLRTQTNIGGAGGFYTGVKAAYEAGADWIVLMDDDGCAQDQETFRILFEQAQQMYLAGEKKLFVNALVQQGDLLSFKIGQMYTVAEALAAAKNGLLEGEANPFNGTLISRELVTAIGYPNKEFFIKGDEVNYKQRAKEGGGHVVTVVNSRYVHPRTDTFEKKVLGIQVPFFVEAPWKEYYTARNFTYMYKQKGFYKAIVFELFFVKMLAIFSIKCSKWKTIRMVLRGLKDGWKGKLGATIRP